MYLRAPWTETSLPTLRKFIRDNPLGVLTTAIALETYPLIQCTHIPFLLDIEDECNEDELGVLRGHMARQNPQAKAMMQVLNQSKTSTQVLEEEISILFTSQIHHYVTPNFYIKTLPTTGRIAPTWNYAAVQVYGRAMIYYDSESNETTSYLSKQLSDLARYGEERIMGYSANTKAKPWKISDAPVDYIKTLSKNIIGVEVKITRLEGKFKMSQERCPEDREGVIQGFKSLESQVGFDIGDMVKEYGQLRDFKIN